MTVWLAWARNALIAWTALTLFAGVATQLLAAIFGYAAHFGEHTPPWFGFPLYEPWRFLKWGLQLGHVRPWIAFLCILLALTFVLAAFAVLVLAGLVAPGDLPQFQSRRGFASWDILGQRGLLGVNGLALGAVCRHAWAKSDIVSQASGKVLIVGDPRHTDAALIAAASTWRGPLLFIDTRGLASRLPRKGVIRFAPGQKGSFSYNPMLATRGGVHAWADACLLAKSFLAHGEDTALTETFAILLLDQLINAPPEQRNLAALRKRLAAPHRLLSEIVAAWPEERCAASAPHSEIARAVRSWRAHPNATLAHFADIDAALIGFSEGNLARMTQAHQFSFGDLVAGSGPRTLVLSAPPGAAATTPLLSAMLAQLVAACASAPAPETPGSSEQQQILVVVEAGALPLWRQILPAYAAAHGCHLLVQAPSLERATSDAFDTIAAIGPQSGPTADKLSERAGHISEWLLLRRDEVSIRNWVFPRWVKVQRQVLPAADLTEADPSQAILFFQDLAPVRARSLYLEGSQATFVAGAELSVAHDWAAPPPPMEPLTQAASAAPATTPLIGAQIRAVLTRRAPPRSKAKATSP